MTGASHLLDVRDLTVEYRQGANWHSAVRNVSFSLRAGEILAVAGESGSGKSTIAQALLGLGQEGVRAAGGQVLFRGQDVLSLKPAQLRRLRGRTIAFVPQNPGTSLTPSMRIGAQIAELFHYHDIAAPGGIAASSENLLASVGLPDPAGMLSRFPHQLSGGQQQRVLIAMALAARPELIVLDEPTTGLDVSNQARILQLLSDLRHDISAALVYVSHDLAALATIADRTLIMHDGRIVEHGSISKVFSFPEDAYTKNLLSSLPTLEHAPASMVKPVHLDSNILPLLSVRKLTIRHLGRSGDTIAANGVSFDIRPGETVALVGESGSGKSSIIKAVIGLHMPESGEIHFDGEPLAGEADARSLSSKRDIQLVFQNADASLNPRHSVGRILTRAVRAFNALSHDQARGRALELMEAVRLQPQLFNSYPKQLSGGQRQRVAIARALAANPRLILCDEILSALDVSVQSEILALLQQLQAERGVALLFISHDLAVVRWLAHRIVVLQKGRIAAQGTPEQMFHPPFEPYTESLINAIPRPSIGRAQPSGQGGSA